MSRGRDLSGTLPLCGRGLGSYDGVPCLSPMEFWVRCDKELALTVDLTHPRQFTSPWFRFKNEFNAGSSRWREVLEVAEYEGIELFVAHAGRLPEGRANCELWGFGGLVQQIMPPRWTSASHPVRRPLI